MAGLVMGKDVATTVGAAVAALAYELVDVERTTRGLLRVFIDRPEGISVEDCAIVSNHLSRVLAVEGIDYDRLEVSSPGLDRPLRKAADFVRFAGNKVDVRMRTPDASGRKRFTGLLRGAQGTVATVQVEGREVALNVDDIDKARLVPDLVKREQR